MLMPVLVIAFGPIQAVPIMAIAAVMANVSRVVAWWKEIDWPRCWAFAATGAPFGALGAVTLLSLPTRIIEAALGVFFISMIGVRRWMEARNLKLHPLHLAIIGVPIGYLTGVVVSTGPLTAPLFVASGLVKGAFVGTEAAATLTVYLAKTAVFRGFGVLPPDIVAKGLLTGSTLMAGSFIAKRFVLAMDPARFRLVMDLLMLLSGLTLLGASFF